MDRDRGEKGARRVITKVETIPRPASHRLQDGQQREKITLGKLTKTILAEGGNSAFTETPDEMVRRVCRELGNNKNLILINDETDHCYRRKPDGEVEKLIGEERREAEKRDEEARVWISGIEAVKAKIGVKTIYDLSVTPFFLRGSVQKP